MSAELATTANHDPAAMAALLGMNPRDPKTHAMVAVCQRYDLDPLLKHVVVIPQGGVYITRDGLLHVAHRSGQLDGIVIESGPDLVDGEWRVVVSVYRKDMSRPFTFPGRYSATGGNRKYAPEMALKVAECMALRRAFDVTGLGILDEVLPDPEPQSRPVERQVGPTLADRVDPWATAPVVDAVVVDDSPAPALDATREAMDLPPRDRSKPTPKQVALVAIRVSEALKAAGVPVTTEARCVLVSEWLQRGAYVESLNDLAVVEVRRFLDADPDLGGLVTTLCARGLLTAELPEPPDYATPED